MDSPLIIKEEIKQEVFDLYDDYAHSRINRRDFVERLSIYAVGGITVTALMSFLMPDYKNTLQTKADDPRLVSEYVTYNSEKGGGTIKALLSKPAGATRKLGGVVVVHENRGLNPYIEDVGRRVALAGFISIAPDALTPLGGYPGDDDKGREMQAKRDKNEMLQNFIDAFEYLAGRPGIMERSPEHNDDDRDSEIATASRRRRRRERHRCTQENGMIAFYAGSGFFFVLVNILLAPPFRIRVGLVLLCIQLSTS